MSTITPSSCQPGILSQCCQPGPYQCGIRYPPVINAPIPGPGQAPYGAYPWQAAILTTTNSYIGTGALITSVHVLTVAHRVVQFVLVILTCHLLKSFRLHKIIFSSTAATLKVRLGEWNAGGQVEPIRPQEFPITQIIINPTFNAGNLKNDVAIIRLALPVPLGKTPTIATVCLPLPNYSFVGSRLVHMPSLC